MFVVDDSTLVLVVVQFWSSFDGTCFDCFCKQKQQLVLTLTLPAHTTFRAPPLWEFRAEQNQYSENDEKISKRKAI